MKKSTLRAMEQNKLLSKSKKQELSESDFRHFDIVNVIKRRCRIIFKNSFEAHTWDNVNTQAVRLKIKLLTLKDFLKFTDANGIVDIEALVNNIVNESKKEDQHS